MTRGRDSFSKEMGSGETRVDLGEDLLAEKTALLQQVPPSQDLTVSPSHTSLPKGDRQNEGDIEDLLQSAKILVNEGLVEDAKKTLRQVLIRFPNHALAQKTLDGIHESELKQIVRYGDEYRPFAKKTQGEVGSAGLDRSDPSQRLGRDAEGLIRQLDQDLGLGLFQEGEQLEATGTSELFLQLEQGLASGSAQDWIDLGIAFLEMELPAIAIRLFAGACRRANLESPQSSESLLSITSLLALALMRGGRPFEALAQIQPLLQDTEILHEKKIELFYLMGRIYELIHKPDLAHQFYQQVIGIDPHYRDVDHRSL